MSSGSRPLVSVIIPSYNHARYLSDAIESVRRQSYSPVEIVIVDDGSTDETPEVASRYPEARYVRQQNKGLAAARNTGIRESRGEYLCFLDADDVLAERAIEIGVRHLMARPECAFVSGDHRRVGPDLQPLFKYPLQPVREQHYLALLRGNYIGMHATVMYRRSVLQEIGGFNESMRACEDYELYLRIARRYAVATHDEVVADYRQHGANMSDDPNFMLRWALTALAGERPFVAGHPERERAYREGERNWRQYYTGKAVDRVRVEFRLAPTGLQSIPWLLFVLRNFPWGATVREKLTLVMKHRLEQLNHAFMRVRPKWLRRRVRLGSFGRLEPSWIGAPGAYDWYVQRFSQDCQRLIKGRVLELGKGQTTTTEAQRLPPASFDAIVCWDLNTSWEPERAVCKLRALLRPGGVLFAALPGVVLPSDQSRPDDYWRFTTLSARRIFEASFPPEDLEISFYGNVLAASTQIRGIPGSELTEAELLHRDPQLQMLITVKAVRRDESGSEL